MKNFLIIGASYGIGLSLAQSIKEGNTIYIASRTHANLKDTNFSHIPFDVLTDTFPIEKIPTVIDGLVYCPGSINLKPFKNIKPEAFLEDFQINFLGMVRVLQAVLPNLLASNSPSIVLFSSVAATLGMPFHTSVAASKAAIEGFAKSFAAEFAPKIRINVVAPSLTETPLAEKFLNTDVKRVKAAERHPLKKFGATNDIAALAKFLLEDQSNWITGQVFHVDGGMSSIFMNA